MTFVLLINSLLISSKNQKLQKFEKIFKKLAFEFYQEINFVWTDGLFNPAKKSILGHRINLK